MYSNWLLIPGDLWPDGIPWKILKVKSILNRLAPKIDIKVELWNQSDARFYWYICLCMICFVITWCEDVMYGIYPSWKENSWILTKAGQPVESLFTGGEISFKYKYTTIHESLYGKCTDAAEMPVVLFGVASRQACSPLIQLFFGFASDINQTNINRHIRDGNWLSSCFYW